MNINPKLLSELIKVSVKAALKEQLPVLIEREIKKLKNELLHEQSQSKTVSKHTPEVKKSNSFSQKYQLTPKKKVKLSSNPTLNEILLQTDPIQTSENPYNAYSSLQNDLAMPSVNVPTTDAGLPIHTVPNHILEAMNRDYSGMFSGKEKVKQQPKVPAQQVKESIRSKFMSVLQDNNDSFIPDDDDMSFDE